MTDSDIQKLISMKIELKDAYDQIENLKDHVSELNEKIKKLDQKINKKNSTDLIWLIENPQYTDFYDAFSLASKQQFGQYYPKPGYIFEDANGLIANVFKVEVSTDEALKNSKDFIEGYFSHFSRTNIKIGENTNRAVVFVVGNIGSVVLAVYEGAYQVITKFKRWNMEVVDFTDLTEALLYAKKLDEEETSRYDY